MSRSQPRLPRVSSVDEVLTLLSSNRRPRVFLASLRARKTTAGVRPWSR
jgi:hypothetical protein